MTVNNCIIFGIWLWLKFKADGAKLVFLDTRREYWWVKMPHCYVEFSNGAQVEYVPVKETLGKFPPPLFWGFPQLRRLPNG